MPSRQPEPAHGRARVPRSTDRTPPRGREPDHLAALSGRGPSGIRVEMNVLHSLPPLPADVRRALRLCLPAAIVAAILRAVLLWHSPAAFVHNDTAASVETAARLVERGAFVLDGKKTFLAPALMSVPAVLRVPVLPFMAVTQHLLGVVLVFVVGLLTFLWFRHWRVFVPVVTLLVAINPVLLWYEHAALAESLAIFGLVLVALAGTVFWRHPGRASFAFLLAAVAWMAGARPEGWLCGGFAIVLVARTLWGRWSAFRMAVPVVVIWALALAAITRTGQSGLLLFTSVLHLTPPTLAFSPGIAEKVAPLAAEARANWESADPPRLAGLRKNLQRLLGPDPKTANAVGARAGLETVLRNLPALPGLALRKFVVAHREPPAGDFSRYVTDEQFDVLTKGDEDERALRYGRLLWGVSLPDPDAARQFLAIHARPLPALTAYGEAWQRAMLVSLAPVRLPGAEAAGVTIAGLPWLYTAAVLGLLALAVRERPLGFHQLWGAFLVGLFVVLMVTANLRARFRVGFEPLWPLYAMALLDSVAILLARVRIRA